MKRTIAMLVAAGLIAATSAQAQNAPPPGNVNPGSMQSGQEQTGAPNQPRSQNQGAVKGTTGSGISSPEQRGMNRDGTNANVKPSSPESGSEPAGEPAGQRR
jgi:hypothetical protein